MAYRNRIVSTAPDGKTTISYNGVKFTTADKSVIKMAQKGNIEGAARRYIGKSSLARSIRQTNKQYANPIYQNVNQALFNKVFKEKDRKKKVRLTEKGFAEYRKKYKKLSAEANKYMMENVKDKVEAIDKIDKLPGELKKEIDEMISEEVEKAYSEGGGVSNSVVDKINNRVKDKTEDYILSHPELDQDMIKQLNEIAELPNAELNRISKLQEYQGS